MLEQFGIHQGTAEVLIIVCMAVAACGVILMMFWKYIAAGLVAVFCLYTFAQRIPEQPAKEVAKAVAPIETAVVEDTKKILADAKEEERKFFMRDCMKIADYTEDQCKEHWEDRQTEEFMVRNGKDEKWVVNR